MKLFFKILR